MNILLVPVTFLPNLGGVEVIANELSVELKNKGHNVEIVTNKWPLSLLSRETINEVLVHRLPFFLPLDLLERNFTTVMKFVLKVLLIPLLVPLTILKLLLILSNQKTEIVNIHYIGANAFYILILKMFFDFKLIVNIHGEDIQRDPYLSKFYNYLTRKTLKKADMILSNSKFLLAGAEKICPDIREKSFVVGNGINLKKSIKREKYNYKKKYILSVGRFVNKKGFDILIKAFARAKEEMRVKLKDYDLIIVGSGDYEKKYKKLASELSINDRIFFYGKADRNELFELMNGCEFFVLPSREEPFGIVLLEAMSAGKAIIATNVGGVPELIINGFNGILVEPEDEKSFAKAIMMLIENDEIKDRLGKAGKKFVLQRYALPLITDKFIECYKQVLHACY